jgi:FkbH-like protein
MLLKRQHIAAARINWQDKAANLREIAAELNLGLDSLVFADDSQFEVDLVRQLVPEVTVLHLPSEKASESRYQLATCGLFETLTLSEEDRRRGAAYQAEAARRQLQTKSGDLASYLRSLEQMLEIRLADSFAVPRIAQLTQKTNQFNLTTRRYSAEDVARMMADDAFDVIHLRHRDRFGDSGLVGVCILRYDGPEATFDSLLLSCRVLGRGVEAAFLTQCLARARQRGARVGVGEYLPTSKNGQVREFYAQQGFSAQGDGADRQRYTIDLADASWPEPEFFHIESDLIRADARSAADS